MAKVFSLVNDSGHAGSPNVNATSEETPLPIPSNKDDFNLPQRSPRNLHRNLSDNGKMVRKRAASEIEIQSGHRFLRRNPVPMTTTTDIIPLGEFGVCSINLGTGSIINHPIPGPTPTHVPNYSTVVLPSSTNLSVTSSVGGSGSQPAFSTTNSAYLDSLSPAPPPLSHNLSYRQAHTQNQSPSVCVFSGLPLFPPERNRNTGGGEQLLTSGGASCTGVDGAIFPMEDSAATAWIDSIIKDLIHNSAHVSIPQLIQNVREIIHPCNPNLAALIEYRLRSLTCNADPVIPSNCTPERSKESIPVPANLQRQDYFHLQGQGQLLVESSGLKIYLDDDNSLSHGPLLQESHSQYLNWGVALPKTTTTNAPGGNSQPELRNSTSAVAPGVAFVSSTALPNLTSHVQQSSEPEETQMPQPLEQQQQGSPAPADAAAARNTKKEEIRQQKRDEEGLHLLTLLLQCAEAVAADNLEEANNMLLEISELSTPFGTSAQRVAAYFSEAMSARLVSSCLGIYASLPAVPHSQKMVSAFQVFNGISPFIKFSHFTANQAIQEAFDREERVHIIDLDIMQGLQWPGLFHILASRPGGPPFVRMTGLGTSMEALEATGKRLSDFAEKLGLPFEFNPVADKVGNLDPERLKVSKREAVAVHWLQHCLYDVSGSDTNTLWLLQR